MSADLRQLALERLGQMETMRLAAENMPHEIALAKEQGATPVQLKEMIARQRELRQWLKATGKALQVLTPEEMLVAQRLLILPAKNNVRRLCQELGVEQSSVYRRREKVLKKVGKALMWEE